VAEWGSIGPVVVRGGTPCGSATPSTAWRPLRPLRPAPCHLPLQGKQPEDLEPTSIRSLVLRLREVIVAPNQIPATPTFHDIPPPSTQLTTPVKRIMDIPSPSAAPLLFRIMSRDLSVHSRIQHLDSGSTGPVGLDSGRTSYHVLD
jgi:hypothetical protein